MRLLTEEELNKAYMGSDYHPDSKIVLGVKHGVERVADAEHKETLKAVGEYLNRHWQVTGNITIEARFANNVIETLLRGEMPEEVK